MSNLKQAVERCADMLDDNPAYLNLTGRLDRDAIRLVLSALSKAEAERDLLAAECRAARSCFAFHASSVLVFNDSAALAKARAATDAAGVLKLSGVMDPECAYMAHADTACTRCGRIHRGEGK
jgi:hypothetical protein